MRRPKQEKIKVSKKKKIVNKLSFHASTSFFSVFSKYPENKINWKDKSAGLYCQSKFFISLCSMSSQNGDNFFGEKKKKVLHLSTIIISWFIWRYFPAVHHGNIFSTLKASTPALINYALLLFMESTDIYIKNHEKKKKKHDTSIENGK